MKAISRITLFLILTSQIATAASTYRPTIAGEWAGEISTGSQTLRVVLHVAAGQDGTLTATMDSPDQGATGIPVSSITFEPPSFHFAIEKLGASYDGVLNEDTSKISGTWKQGPASLMLNFKRAAK